MNFTAMKPVIVQNFYIHVSFILMENSRNIYSIWIYNGTRLYYIKPWSQQKNQLSLSHVIHKHSVVSFEMGKKMLFSDSNILGSQLL